MANAIRQLTAATARRRDAQEAWGAIVAAAGQGWSHEVIARAAGVEEIDVRRVLRKRKGAGPPQSG